MKIMQLLRDIPVWNDLVKLPKKIADLEKRVEALENAKTPSFDTCPSCKRPTFKLISSKPDPMMGEMGVLLRTYKCSDCNFEETRTYES